MKFYGTFGLAELGPGKNGEAKVDHVGVKQIEFAAEFKPVLRSKLTGPLQQLMEHSLIQFSRLLFLDPDQGGSGTRLEDNLWQEHQIHVEENFQLFAARL